MRKIIACILIALSLVAINGCTTDDTASQSRIMKSVDFNQSSYVWESLYFPTNRTSGAQ